MKTRQGSLRAHPSLSRRRTVGSLLSQALLMLGVLVGVGILALHLLDLPSDLPAASPANTAAVGRAQSPATSPPLVSADPRAAQEPRPGGTTRPDPRLVRTGTNSHPGTAATKTQTPAPSGSNSGAEPRAALGTTQNASPPPRDPPSIVGRVLDGDGNPLVGIEVQAHVERLFGPSTPDSRAEGAASTGANGVYALSGLSDGQYRISAESSGYTRAEITARTGAGDADLVLHWEKAVRVYGRLTNRGGKPIEGARVTPNLSPAISVPTDAQGRYEVSVSLREDVDAFDIRFEHPQHTPESRRLAEPSWEATGALELNVALEPISQTTTLSGRMQSTTGEAVAGETLILYSPSLMRRFETVSGGDGAFRIPEVAIAPDYLVSVRPRGPYQDYTKRDLRIIGPTELAIPLLPMESGALVGRMTDVYGNPIPNLTLMLNSTAAAGRTLAVTGNARGQFVVTDVPFGELVFQTHSFPFFRISNLRLGSQTAEVSLVLDWGPYEVRGRVLDEAGFALAAPEVYLSWSQTHSGIRSTAVRRTTADADGFFRFARLGAGPHRVTVNVPGYRAGHVDQDVGVRAGEIVVQLEPETLR